MTALALTDAGLREVAGICRTGLIIASSVPELGEQVREEFGFPACGRQMSGSTLASRTVPRMRAAEEAGPSGPAPAGAVSCGGAGNPARSVT